MAISQFPTDLLRGAPQQAQPQAVTVPALGDKQVFFGPNVPPEERKAALDSLIAQQNFNQQVGEIPPLGRVMARLFTDAGEQMSQPSQIPYLKGNIFGMSTDQLNQSLGLVQQGRQASAYEKMRQRIATEKALEAEKDRAQELSLAAARQKNEEAERAMREKEMEQRLRLSEQESDMSRERFEWDKQQAQQEANAPIRVGSSLIDPRTYKPIYTEPDRSGGGGGGPSTTPKAFSSSSWAKHEDGNEYVVNRFNDGTWAFAVDQNGKMLPATEEVKRAIVTNQGIMGQTNLGGPNLIPLQMPNNIPSNTAQPPERVQQSNIDFADLEMNAVDRLAQGGIENPTREQITAEMINIGKEREQVRAAILGAQPANPGSTTTQPAGNTITAPDGAVVEITD